MKLIHIKIENVLGVRQIDVPLPTPITIFAGPNHSGKSSLQNCIHYALTTQLPRVSQKKEIKALIHEGQKTGKIRIHTDISTVPRNLALPIGTISGPSSTHVALPYLLDPALFATLKSNERRTLLFELSGVKATAAEVNERLKALGCDMELVKLIMPTLKKGYQEAQKEAAENATKAKGAWSFIAGERWGSAKAETWSCEIPECKIDSDDVDEKKIKLTELQTELTSFHRTMGELSEKNINFDKEVKLISDLKAKAKDCVELRIKAEEVEAQLQEQKQEVGRLASIVDSPKTQPCPRCAEQLIVCTGGKIMPADSIICTDKIIEEFNAAKADLAQIENIHFQAKQKHDAANSAYSQLQYRPEVIRPEPFDSDSYDSQTHKLGLDIAKINDVLAEQKKYQSLIENALQSNSKAEIEHRKVLAWLKISEAFAPDGIPSELLSEALTPINKRLLIHANTTGWLHTCITPNVEIVANGRPYQLLSESEQWRVNAMLVEAISHVSELKIFCLDRLDVLDVRSRTDLIKWLLSLSKSGDIDTCILSGTLKALPEIPGITSYWIENGIIENSCKE